MADCPQDVRAALEEARARLQRQLEADEHWRALMHARAVSDGADTDARRARDRRLEMALAANGTYRAWRHVGEALAALSGPGVQQLAAASDAGRPPDQPAGDELPPHIADLLRRRAAEEARLAEARRPDQRPMTGELSASPRAAPRRGVPTGAPGEVPRTSAAATEAAVTFVVRGPGVPEGERRPQLRERLRAVSLDPEPAARAFTPPQAPVEEAEVEILTADAIRERRAGEEQASSGGSAPKISPGHERV